jgi:ABC-2 type transport system ATP-binding protein
MIGELVGEGRTVVLSSHLLDEVEKTCDQVAIVDRGRIVVQGPIEELTRGGAPSLLLATSDDERARQLVSAHASVARVERTHGGLDVRLHADSNGALPNTTADLNRTLVLAGVDVYRLEPEHASLERRFLDLTSRLENAA